MPATRAIRRRSEIPISIDTSKAEVARQALAAGATMINDVSALRHDPGMIDVVRSFAGPVILMHMQGDPGDMQVAPCYANVVAEINDFFAERIAWLESLGVSRSRVVVDPGIGFGKTLDHNLSILRAVAAFKQHGCPVLVGHSRKSFIGQLLNLSTAERDCATAVVSALCVGCGVDILRVHDVRGTVCAVQLAEALA